METGLKRISGNKIKNKLKNVSNNPIKGVIFGTIITAIAQSSSAVSVSLIGMSEAGLITFSQSVYIIMGANIGTSTTAWIISLSDLSGKIVFLKLLNISTLRGYSSAGRVLDWQSRGHGFEPRYLHQKTTAPLGVVIFCL